MEFDSSSSVPLVACHDTACLEHFSAGCRTVRAASAYGVDYREINHNAFLATVVSSPLGSALVRHLAAAALPSVGDADAEVAALLSTLAREVPAVDNVSFNRAAPDGGRPDLRVDGTSGGRPFVLIVELKIQASGGQEQLAKYVSTARDESMDRVAGILVRIPGTDVHPAGPAPVLAGADLARVLEGALRDTTEADDKLRWLAHDYLDTLRFLDVADHVAVHHADTLRASTDPRLECWGTDNERWIYERVAREIGVRALEFMPGWNSWPAWKDANGAFVDIWRDDPYSVAQGRSGAEVFLKWRVKYGLEVHGITKGYLEGNVTERSIRVLNALVEATSDEVRPHWEDRGMRISNRPGKSRMIARLPQESLSAAAALDTIRAELPMLEAALARATAAVLRAGVP